MDIKDISESQYYDLMKKQKGILETASKRRGECPADRKPRAQAIQDHMTSHLRFRMMQLSNGAGLIRSSYIATPYLPSVTAMEDLKKTMISELRLETHHRGCYVLLRIVTPPVWLTAIMTVVEDESEDVTSLNVYQQEEDGRAAEEIMRVKSVCIVKEPYFKIGGDGKYAIRVDHVNDLNWLAEDDERIPLQWRPQITDLSKTANDWKEEGNSAFRLGKYHDAVKDYSAALRCSTTAEESQIIRFNRALAFLKIGNYDGALHDATCIPADKKQSEKGLYRAALASYELRRFQECRNLLESLTTAYPNNMEGKVKLSHVNKRLQELEKGEYSFQPMYASVRSGSMYLDLATYIGPVEVKPSQGRGRGLFTTRAVKAGELLLCEKAFAYCAATAPDGSAPASSSKIKVLMNLQTNRIMLGTQADLITTVVNKLSRNPSLSHEFTSLHHGSYEPIKETHVDGEPVVDTFLVERVVSLNVFGCPPTSFAAHFSKPSTDKKSEMGFDASGIWIQASYINHSCYFNTRRSFIGDMQLVRATQNIPAGEELTFIYMDAHPEGHISMNEGLLSHWGFECDCAMCTDARTTPKKVMKRRRALENDLEALLRSSSLTADQLSKAERLTTAIEQTHKSPAADVPRRKLAESYLHLVRHHASHDDQPSQQKTAILALKSLGSLGFVIRGGTSPSDSSLVVEQWGLVTDNLVETWMHLAGAYVLAGTPQLVEAARAHARTSYAICVGEDETFDQTYDRAFREMDPVAMEKFVRELSECKL